MRAAALFVIAIPVSNERDRIIPCLRALAGQSEVDVASMHVLLFLNNCTDGTRGTIEAWQAQNPVSMRLIECNSDAASAGWARRKAMEAAALWLEEMGAANGILLTTDADSRVAKDWVLQNRIAVNAGADAVAGRFTFDEAEAHSFASSLRRRNRLEIEYETLLAEIEGRLAPRPGDPWPFHRTNSGASIAVRSRVYRDVGGIPAVSNGEDRAFIERILAHGFVVRHAPEVQVTTSGRLDGRARGGTADTLKRRTIDVDSPCDAHLAGLHAFVSHLLLRRLGVRRSRAWSNAGQRLQPSALPEQIRRARCLISYLRWLAEGRGDTQTVEPSFVAHDSEQLSTL